MSDNPITENIRTPFSTVATPPSRTIHYIIESLKIPEDDKIARIAIGFVFMQHSGRRSHDISYFTKRAADDTIEKVGDRYAKIQHYGPNFFAANYDLDYDALVLAALLDDQMANLDHPNQLRIKELPFSSGYATRNLIARASSIFDQAADLEKYGRKGLEPVQKPEVLFLALMNSLQRMQNLHDEIDSPSDDELQNVLRYDIPLIDSYICKRSDLGNDLLALMQYFSDVIIDLFPQAKNIVTRPSLVYSREPDPK